MENSHGEEFALPPKFEYVRDTLQDAVWLILSVIEAEERRRQALLTPRKLILEIDIMPAENLLPVRVRETSSIGEAYTSRNTTTYSSQPYGMGTPGMYYDDPSEYWRTRASTNYLNYKNNPA